MKSIKKFKLFISAIIVLVSVDAVAKDFVYEGITYTVIDEDARTCQTKEGRSGGYGAENNVTGNIILPEHPMDGSTEYTLTVIGKATAV